MVSKAYRIPSSSDRLRKQQREIKDLQAQFRNRNTPRSNAATAFSGVSAAGGVGNFLDTSGGTMIGAFALNPPVDFTVDIDSSNTIDIGQSSDNKQYSSNIQIEDVPTSTTLHIIKGAAFDGQILVVRTFAPNPITIQSGTLANGGNIQTPDDVDVILGNLQMIFFIFDEKLVINENTGGTWRLLNTFGTEGGSTGYNIIQEEGISLTQRSIMNFIGGTVTAVDNSGEGRTDITITGGVSAGTIENQHLEWNNSTLEYESKVNLEFGSVGPFADSGFIRYANDQIMLSARNPFNTGNIEVKTDSTLSRVDITDSGQGGSVGLLLRAQDSIDPDQIFSLSQGKGISADSIMVAPTRLIIDAGVQSFAFALDAAELELQVDLNMKTFDIINIDRARFSQSSGGLIGIGDPTIYVDNIGDGDLVINNVNTEAIIFTHSNVIGLVDTVSTLRKSRVNGLPIFQIVREGTVPSEGTSIADIRGLFPRTGFVEELSSIISFTAENIGTSTFEGGMAFQINQQSGQNIFMRFNSLRNDQIDTFRDINMNDHILFNVISILMTGTSKDITGVDLISFDEVNQFLASETGELIYHVGTNDEHKFFVGTAVQLTISALEMNVFGNNITEVVNIKSNGSGGATTGVIGELIIADGGFNYFVRDTIAWEEDANTEINFTNSGIDILTNGTSDDIDIVTAGLTSNINLTSTNMQFHATASTGINILINSDLRMTIQDNFLSLQVPITMNGSHIEFLEQTAPTQVANSSMLYSKDVSEVTHLFTRDSDGTEHDLSLGGGITNLSDLIIDADKDWSTRNITNLGGITMSGNIDVNTFNIINIDRAQFTPSSGGLIDVLVPTIYVDLQTDGNLVINNRDNKAIIFTHSDVIGLQLTNTTLRKSVVTGLPRIQIANEGNVPFTSNSIGDITGLFNRTSGGETVSGVISFTAEDTGDATAEGGIAFQVHQPTGDNIFMRFNTLANDRIDMFRDVDMNGLNIKNLEAIEFKLEALTNPSLTIPFISWNGIDMTFNAPIIDGNYDFFINNTFVFSISKTLVGGSSVTLLDDADLVLTGGVIQIDEVITPTAPSTGRGLFYAKDIAGVAEPFWQDENGTETSMLSGGGGGGANINLSNLSNTSVNDNIIPQIGKTLGSSGNEWSSVHTNNLRLGIAGVVNATSNQILGTSSGIDFNVPTGANYEFLVDGTSVGSISNSGTLNFISAIINNVLSIGNIGSFSGDNGDIFREGIDIKIVSGGIERNISDIGGSGANTALSNLDLTTSINSNEFIPATDGTQNLGGASNKWANIYGGRMVFPSGTSINSGQANIVKNTSNDMQFNVATGNTFEWTFQGGAVQVEMSSSTLELFGVDLDMSDNNINNISTLTSNAADPADSGFIRMGNAETIVWEANTTGVDITLQVDANNHFVFSGNLTPSGSRTIGLDTDRWNAGFFDFLDVSNTVLLRGNVDLGTDDVNTISFFGEVDTDIIPDADNARALGSSIRTWDFIYNKGGVLIIEGYVTGFKPAGQTNTAILFTVPTAGGKTELRSSFQTGGSVIIVTEP